MIPVTEQTRSSPLHVRPCPHHRMETNLQLDERALEGRADGVCLARRESGGPGAHRDGDVGGGDGRVEVSTGAAECGNAGAILLEFCAHLAVAGRLSHFSDLRGRERGREVGSRVSSLTGRSTQRAHACPPALRPTLVNLAWSPRRSAATRLEGAAVQRSRNCARRAALEAASSSSAEVTCGFRRKGG